MQDLMKYIVIDPNVRVGKPCIVGTRIAISDILQWLASGMSIQEVLDDYPLLKEEHVRAALYFAAHREMLTKVSAA